MESDTLCYLSLQDLSAQLRTGKLSSVEVTRCILDRIHRMNPRLHAYLTVLDESALYRAAQVDEEIRAGHWRGPLHGVPIAVKDLCQTKGVLTTCASRDLARLATGFERHRGGAPRGSGRRTRRQA